MFPGLVATLDGSVWRARPAASSLGGGMLASCVGNWDAGCRSRWIRGGVEVCAGEIMFGIENWALGCSMCGGGSSGVGGDIDSLQD